MPPRVNAPVAMIAETTWITSQYDVQRLGQRRDRRVEPDRRDHQHVSTNATTIGAIQASRNRW